MKLETLFPYAFTLFLVFISTFGLESKINMVADSSDTYSIKADLDNMKYTIADNLEKSTDQIDTLSGKIYQLDKTINDLGVQSTLKIYSLNVTACILDEKENVINKRHIRLDYMVGINPTIGDTHGIDTGAGYYPLSLETDEYICDLKVLSVK